MEKLKVIFRKDKEGLVHAFFPECSANFGNILCFTVEGKYYWMDVCGHNEASLEYYWTTSKAAPNEYAPLLEKLKGIYDDVELVVKQKLYYSDLTDKAWKRRVI